MHPQLGSRWIYVAQQMLHSGGVGEEIFHSKEQPTNKHYHPVVSGPDWEAKVIRQAMRRASARLVVAAVLDVSRGMIVCLSVAIL